MAANPCKRAPQGATRGHGWASAHLCVKFIAGLGLPAEVEEAPPGADPRDLHRLVRASQLALGGMPSPYRLGRCAGFAPRRPSILPCIGRPGRVRNPIGHRSRCRIVG